MTKTQSSDGIERRVFIGSEIKIEEREGGARKFVGHAAVFNSLSEDLGGFREQIAPGAFKDAVLKDDIPLLINHDGLPIARNLSGTMKVFEDLRGLAVEADLDLSDPDVQRILPKMARGDLNKMSFAFRVQPGGQDWAKDDEGRTIRTLKNLRLFDVSIVTRPAYNDTSAAMRSLDDWQKSTVSPALPDFDVMRRRLDLLR